MGRGGIEHRARCWEGRLGWKDPDLYRRGTRSEPNFPDGNGCRASSYELQGFSVSPDVVREQNLTAVERMECMYTPEATSQM
jgi:hypothetical protein